MPQYLETRVKFPVSRETERSRGNPHWGASQQVRSLYTFWLLRPRSPNATFEIVSELQI
jgi:hypothetical protein